MAFSQKYTVIQLFEPIDEGFEYDAGQWPLHVTVADTFSVAWDTETLLKECERAFTALRCVNAVAGGSARFGEHGQVRVTLVSKTPELAQLHQQVVNTLKKGGVVFNDPQFMENGYRPHATVQPHGQLRKGDKVEFTALSIIDMFPGGNPYRRKLLKTIRLLC